MGTINLYLAKAIESYPYELAKVIENLDYALAYEPDNANALALMGRVYLEEFEDAQKALECFEAALVSDMDQPFIYSYYIIALINTENYERAMNLIDYAMTVKGIDKARILVLKAQLFETMRDFEKAELSYKEAIDVSMNNNFIDYAEQELSRLVKKKQRQNRKKDAVSNKKKDESHIASKTSHWLRNRLNNLL